jgi:branched-subunit amino acid transport protein
VTARPPALLLAVVVLALEGVGAVGFGIFLAVLAGGVLEEIQPFGALLPASSIAFGVAALVAAIAAWRRRSWGWVVAAAIQAILLLGVIVAAMSGAFHPALLAAVALGGLGLVALFHEDTRQALVV